MVSSFKNENNMCLLERPMRVEEIENGIILPQRDDDSTLWGLGGVCDANNRFVELSFYDGGWATHGGIYEWDSEEYCDCDVLYFGMYFNHWGHFLVDLIGRLWYFSKRPEKSKGLKVALLGEEHPKGNFLEFFELLGIREEDFIHITKPTRFKKVIVPEFSCRSCEWYSQEYKSIFNFIIDKVKDEGYVPEDLPDINKVYFSRLAFKKANDSEFGEERIAQWFTSNGFSVIAPEKLTIRGQVYVWNNAKEISCLNGSIPISVAFSNNPDLILNVLHKTHLPHLNLELFLLMRPCKVTLFDAYREPFKNYPKSIGAGPFLFHLGEDAREFSKLNNMVFPFSEKELLRDYRKNRTKLFFNILNIKGRIRLFLSRIIPQGLKNKIRKVIHRGG